MERVPLPVRCRFNEAEIHISKSTYVFLKEVTPRLIHEELKLLINVAGF